MLVANNDTGRLCFAVHSNLSTGILGEILLIFIRLCELLSWLRSAEETGLVEWRWTHHVVCWLTSCESRIRVWGLQGESNDSTYLKMKKWEVEQLFIVNHVEFSSRNTVGQGKGKALNWGWLNQKVNRAIPYWLCLLSQGCMSWHKARLFVFQQLSRERVRNGENLVRL